VVATAARVVALAVAV